MVFSIDSFYVLYNPNEYFLKGSVMRKGIDYCPKCFTTPAPDTNNGWRVYKCSNVKCANYGEIVYNHKPQGEKQEPDGLGKTAP